MSDRTQKLNEIFCEGEILHHVQLGGLFPDSKTFVDKHLKKDEIEVRESFHHLLQTKSTLDKEDLQNFVKENFDEEGSELEYWSPPDWKEEPEYISNMKDDLMKEFALNLHGMWKELGRKMKDDVKNHESRYSLLYVPNGMIVPGGRFREFYYWDTYWVIRALLLSDMIETVKGMLENFFIILNEYGRVPNGGRVYYLSRSQPPLLILMVYEYWKCSGDSNFIIQNFHTLKKELIFWEENRSLQLSHGGKSYKFFRYGSDECTPRPESYCEDYYVSENLESQEKSGLYENLRAGAESGWDFSSRWLKFDDTSTTENSNDPSMFHLSQICTTNVIPVDLNSIMYLNYKLMAFISSNIIERNDEKSKSQENFTNSCRDKAGNLAKAIEEVLWDVDEKIWLDSHIQYSNTGEATVSNRRKLFYVSNVFPIWAALYEKNVSKRENFQDPLIEKVCNKSECQILSNYLKLKKLLIEGEDDTTNKLGIIPTSLIHSGQQWDWPNVWPPLVHILVQALVLSDNECNKKLGKKIASKFVKCTIETFKKKKREDNNDGKLVPLYEKYDVRYEDGRGGEGGEYDVQLGFGWTNAVVIEFITSFHT